jgi:hypothetical protein
MGAHRSLTRGTLRTRSKSSEEGGGSCKRGGTWPSCKKSRQTVVDHDASAAPLLLGGARSLRAFFMPLFTNGIEVEFSEVGLQDRAYPRS